MANIQLADNLRRLRKQYNYTGSDRQKAAYHSSGLFKL